MNTELEWAIWMEAIYQIWKKNQPPPDDRATCVKFFEDAVGEIDDIRAGFFKTGGN